MAATRTIHRGSKGRFAGASNGKAEIVKNGRFNAGSRPKLASAPSSSAASRPPAKGSSKRTPVRKRITTKVKIFTHDNPVLVGQVLGYGAIVGAGAAMSGYAAATRAIGTRATENRAAATIAVSRGLPGATPLAKSRRGAYRVTSLR